MKQVLVVSGKGGTGKTTITAALVALSGGQVCADCDVDAPNLHLALRLQEVSSTEDFYGLPKAVIDAARCTGCGLCEQHCRFDAILGQEGHCVVDPFRCEGCGVCTWVCPAAAATMQPWKAGELQLYRQPLLASTARLHMGSGNSGLLVTDVKRRLQSALEAQALDPAVVFNDGPPGIGCPVIASMTGMDVVLVVAEPSVSGISDLKRLVTMARGLHVAMAICVNQGDISPQHTAAVVEFCRDRDLQYLGSIPHDPTVVELVNQGKTIVDQPCPAGRAVVAIHRKLLHFVMQTDQEQGMFP